MASAHKALQELLCMDDETFEKEIRRPAFYLSLSAMTWILIGPILIAIAFIWRFHQTP